MEFTKVEGGEKMKNKKGFTLVELLVVIAIIGILSTVAVVNLNSARDKAKAASAQAALVQLTSAAIICQDDGLNLTYTGALTCDDNNAPVAGQVVCVGSSATWPTLPTGYNYIGAVGAGCSSDYTTGVWDFAATDGTKTVTCDQTGCVVS